MSFSISTSLSTTATSAASNAPSSPTPAPKTQPVYIPPDTVQLSETQQVYQLYNQGQKVPQIAATLSLTEDAVDNYLNILASTP